MERNDGSGDRKVLCMQKKFSFFICNVRGSSCFGRKDPSQLKTTSRSKDRMAYAAALLCRRGPF